MPIEKPEPRRVLIFGPDLATRHVLVEHFMAWHFEVIEAGSEMKVLHRLKEHVPDAVICLWPMRATHGGLDLLTFLRNSEDRLVIAIVDFEGDISTMHRFLQAGADLCCGQLYDIESLIIHLDVAIRRRWTTAASQLRFGDLVVDIRSHLAWRGEVRLELTPTEFRLLVSFMRRPGHVVSKTVLLEECWRRQDDLSHGGDHLVEVHIGSLRRKLHACGTPILMTIHSLGYVLREGDSTIEG